MASVKLRNLLRKVFIIHSNIIRPGIIYLYIICSDIIHSDRIDSLLCDEPSTCRFSLCIGELYKYGSNWQVSLEPTSECIKTQYFTEKSNILPFQAKTMDAQEFEKRYTNGQTVFSGQSLVGLHFRDLVLEQLDFSNANLMGAQFTAVNLFHATLAGASLVATRAVESKFNGANFSKADLSGSEFIGAILTHSNLSEAVMISINLSMANLTGANLTKANLKGLSLLIGAELAYADLREANLSGAILSGANLSGANLSGANLSFANLDGADLRGTNFSGASLQDASLRDAQISQASFEGATLTGAKGMEYSFI